MSNEESSIWLNPRGAVFTGVYSPNSDSIDNASILDSGMSIIDRDIFYDPTDEELDDYISQSIADGFNPMEMLSALPGAFSEIVGQIKETIQQVPNTELHKLPGTGLEALIRGGSDTGDLLMRIGSGVATMGFKALPGDAGEQYHDLPEPMKQFARGYFRQRRTIEQHRAKQMMGDANYSYLPPALVDNTLAEGLTIFADPMTVAGFGSGIAFRSAAKAAMKGTKPSIVSRGIINTAVKTGQMQEALFGAVTKVATSPVRGAAYLAREASNFAGEALDQAKARMPKRVSGEPIDVDLPQEGKIGWLRRGLTAAGNITDDAMELASEIKRQSKDVNLPGVMDRIARDTSVRSGARDMANILSTLGRNPVSRGLLIPGYKVSKSVAQGATAGGVLGLLSFDEEFAASMMAGGALFGPFGQLSSELIFAKERKAQQVDNFIDDFRLKLDPDDLINFEDWTGGNREDAKFFAGLSYLFKNGHFRNGEGNLDIRFLDDEQYQKYGQVRGENFSTTAGVNFVSSGGRNTILVNTSKKGTTRDTLAHELGHAIMKMPEVQDSLMTQDRLLFGDRAVKMVDGKEVLTFNNEGLLTKDWIDAFYENYVNSLDPAIQPEYRAIKDEDKFLIARDEIYADSMREFFGKFDPESFIRSGKINKLKFRIGGSYERNLFNGLGGSAARGLIGNVLMARNSLGLYAIRNMGRAMGLIKEGEALKLKDGRVFSNIADMLQKRRDNISLVEDPSRDVIGTKWNASQINSKDGREIFSHFQATIPLLRGEDGNPIIRNGRYKFQNKRQRQKADKERADAAKRAVDTTVNSGESLDGLSMFQILENSAYRGDFFGKSTIDAMLATSKRVFTPHLMDVIMRLNNRMRSRIQDSGFLIEFTYNQVKETKKITPDIITSYRQLVPVVFEMSKNGRNFRVTGLDMNDIMTRLDLFERAEKGTERGKIYDLWRDEYRKQGGKDSDISMAYNPVRGLFLQDLWLYLSGLSEGKTGIDALGGKGNTDASHVGVTQKRDGLMRFLGFEKKDQVLSNENMFQQLVDKNRIIKSFRLDRLQNLTISDQPTTATFGAFLGAQTNRAPGSLYSFKGSGEGKPAQDLPKGDVPGGDADTLPMTYDRDAKGNVKIEKDKPKVLQQQYDFLDSPLVQSIIDKAGDSQQAANDLNAIVTSLNTSKLDARNKLTDRQAELYDTIVDQYSDAFAKDFARWKDDPDVLSAIGWYSGVAKNISNLIPNDADRHIFLEFLGGTSPNTSVEQNFLYAIDLFNRWKAGGLKQYVDARDKTFKAYEDGSLIAQYVTETENPVWNRKKGKIEKDKQGNKVQKVKDGVPIFEYKWNSVKARNKFVKLYAEAESGNKSAKDFERSVKKARSIANNITPQHILNVSLFEAGAIPVRKNGGKYGVHTDRVFQIVEGVWEAETDAPKAVNFTGNLKGTRTTATIDVWAARFLRRIGYESGGAPWRIQPSAETGVKNSDFYFGQDAFEAATKKIADKYGETFKMSADDLQAVMWFAEKRNWAQRGWSRVEDFGDFRDYLYKMQQESDGSLKLKEAVLRATSEDFYKSLEFPAEDIQMPAATRKRRFELSKKILSARRKIERARAKAQRTMRQVEAAQARVDGAKTAAAKAKAKTALKEKRKLADAAQKALDQVNQDVRDMREFRMTMEEGPVTYSR